MQDLHSTIYLPRARALNPPVRRSRSQAEPWQPRAERPSGWLNLHARKGVSTFGNTGKHRPADWYLSRDDSLPAYTEILRFTQDDEWEAGLPSH